MLRHLPGAGRPQPVDRLALLRTAMPPVPFGTLYDRLPACGKNQAVIVEPPGEVRRTVFYFPGCGSERLYSRVALASIHILIGTGARVVLPPPFLCCGFPARVNAKTDLHRRQAMRTAVILNQIRERLGHLRFDALAVSCGTCMESLVDMQADAMFCGPIRDISRLAVGHGLAVGSPGLRMYHAPCHDSLQGQGEDLLGRLGGPVVAVPHCCGEAGTLALSRPDIAAAMRARKRDALRNAMGESADPEKIVLTNCPSCLSGLGRQESLGVRVRHLAEELAMGLDGEKWLDETVAWRNRARVVDF
jgi:D-lactate dehydrogenase (cytochrome)